MTFPWLLNNTRIKDDPKPVNKHDVHNDNHALNSREQLESIEVSKTESRKSIHSTSLTENESCIKLESRQSCSNETQSQSIMIKYSKEISVNTADLGSSTLNKIEQGYDEISKGSNPNIIDVFISSENTACQNVSTNQPDGGAEGTISLEKGYDLEIKDTPNSQEDKEHISKTVCDVQNEATEANGKLESNNLNNIDGLISTENTDCQNISTNLPDCEAKGTLSMGKCYDLEIKDTPNSHEDRGHISETVCDVLNEATQENDILESNNLNNINVLISTENTDCPNVSTNLQNGKAEGTTGINLDKGYDLKITDTTNQHEDLGHISEAESDVQNEAAQDNGKLKTDTGQDNNKISNSSDDIKLI
jgi:hypothetical protein